jgi:hypothetical protein
MTKETRERIQNLIIDYGSKRMMKGVLLGNDEKNINNEYDELNIAERDILNEIIELLIEEEE